MDIQKSIEQRVDWIKSLLQSTGAKGIIYGKSLGSKVLFEPQSKLTRAEAITMLGRIFENLLAEIKELKALQRKENSPQISKDLDALILKRTKAYRDILKSISLVNNSAYRRILIKRYLRNEDIKRIAFEMHYSYEYMYELLKRAEAEIKVIEKS